MVKDIEPIMNPQSIAVIGATNRPGSVGLSVFINVLTGGYRGVLYPVNPKVRSVQSVKAVPRLMDIPDEIDLAIIIVPAEVVPPIIEEAAEKKVKAVIVITAGFKEVGGRGSELENRLKALVKAIWPSHGGP
jgi:acyl-CoA synthetase (NDP forming)